MNSGLSRLQFSQHSPEALRAARLAWFRSYTFPLGTVRVMGLSPYQEPRCLAWYSLWAFLLCLFSGTICVIGSPPFRITVLLRFPKKSCHFARILLFYSTSQNGGDCYGFQPVPCH